MRRNNFFFLSRKENKFWLMFFLLINFDQDEENEVIVSRLSSIEKIN